MRRMLAAGAIALLMSQTGHVARAEPVATVLPAITYATADGRDLLLDLYLPAPGPAPAPLIVYIHGGAWKFGSRTNDGNAMPWGTVAGMAATLTARGYAVASVEHRFSTQARWPAQLYDVKAAVRWLRANADEYHLNPEKVAAWGDSSGGQLAAMLGVTGDDPRFDGDLGNAEQSSRVQAVVDWFGPTDLRTMDRQRAPFGLRHDAAGSPESDLLGCVPSSCPELAGDASPIDHISDRTPPFLIQHGRFDHIVPFGQSPEFYDALTAAGVPAEFHAYDTDHEFLGPASMPEILDPFYRFLDRELR
ncbi:MULTISPECIES: alpha/beta hydrolase [unclassified Nocardia]|uniref:alpha/beta hydrolase n=1 Tax=unclassified Nocardia TaxID=2637762 RepID=UPI001CE42709|nr:MULTISPECIES: alpha/beta hydrolase [unclassified Nocardia]